MTTNTNPAPAAVLTIAELATLVQRDGWQHATDIVDSITVHSDDSAEVYYPGSVVVVSTLPGSAIRVSWQFGFSARCDRTDTSADRAYSLLHTLSHSDEAEEEAILISGFSLIDEDGDAVTGGWLQSELRELLPAAFRTVDTSALLDHLEASALLDHLEAA